MKMWRGLESKMTVALTLSLGCCVGLLHAADYEWLASPASAAWNETDANWVGAGIVWANGSTNNAAFGDSSEKSITADAVTLSNLTFNADGYTVGGGPLAMYGPSFTVAANVTAELTAPIVHPAASIVLNKLGAGALVLNPGDGTASNIFASAKVVQGTMQIVGGTNLITLSGTSPESNPSLWVSGGRLVVAGGLLKSTCDKFARVSDYGLLLITNGYVDLTSYSELLNAHNSPGNTTVAGNGTLDVTTLRISQCNWSAASNSVVNVNTGGVLKLTHFGIDPKNAPKGMVNFNGGTVVAKSNYTDFLGAYTNVWTQGIVCRVLEGGAVFDTGVNLISIKQPLVSGAVADGGLTKRGAGVLTLLSTNCYNGPTVVEGGQLIFDPQTNTQTLFNVVTCVDSDCTVAKSGNGTLVFDPGAAAVNTFGTLWCSNGTMVVASGTNYVTQYCNVQNGPGLRVSGGTLLVAGGILMTTTGQYVNVDGGHLLVTNGVVDTLSCTEILNGIGSTYGYTTVSGSGVLLANRVRVSQNFNNFSNNVVSVNTGGVLRLNGFYIDVNALQKGIVALNGGTVEARSDTADFLGTTATFIGNNSDRWLTNIIVNVREGGAIFDTAGKTISIKQPLYTDVAQDGGLIKRGAGTLTLLNTNTYSGATVAEGGTLKFGRDELLPTGNVARAAAGGVLDVNGLTQTLAGIGGAGVITNLAALTVTDTIEPGDPIILGTLTLAGAPASIDGCALAVNVSTNGACGRLHVQGDLDLSTLSLSLGNPSELNRFKNYVVASCSGTLTVPFASVGALPSRWFIQYDTQAKTVSLDYNFGTLISVR